MGVALIAGEAEPTGLVFQTGKQEAYGLKFQPPDLDERAASQWLLANQRLIALALPLYLKHQYQGIMLPCAYYRAKPDGRAESGLAFFAGPHPADKLNATSNAEPRYDNRLGRGATKMIFDMVAAVYEAGNRIGITQNTLIGIDLRPRLAFERLAMPFLVHGAKVFAIQHPLREAHPVWEYAGRAGFAKFPYAPMVPFALAGRPDVPDSWEARVKSLSKRPRRTWWLPWV